VRNGYSCVPISLSEGLNIRLSSAAKRIKYNSSGVEIHIESTKPGVALNNNKENIKPEIDRADAVLITIPLGCLKEKAQNLFEPRLPNWKLDSIKRLGFGNLNKVLFVSMC
jgi:lysine-specific histone demethylase 1